MILLPSLILCSLAVHSILYVVASTPDCGEIVNCNLNCEFGFVADNDDCEICLCRTEIQTPSEIEVKPGEQKELSCVVTELPNPKILGWTFNGDTLFVAGRHDDNQDGYAARHDVNQDGKTDVLLFDNSTLLIVDATEHNTGIYSCIVEIELDKHVYNVSVHFKISYKGGGKKPSKEDRYIPVAASASAGSLVVVLLAIVAWYFLIRKQLRKDVRSRKHRHHRRHSSHRHGSRHSHRSSRHGSFREEPGASRHGSVRGESGTSRHGSVRGESGTSRHGSVRGESGTSRHGSVRREPGTSRHGSVRREPGICRHESLRREACSRQNSVKQKCQQFVDDIESSGHIEDKLLFEYRRRAHSLNINENASAHDHTNKVYTSPKVHPSPDTPSHKQSPKFCHHSKCRCHRYSDVPDGDSPVIQTRCGSHRKRCTSPPDHCCLEADAKINTGQYDNHEHRTGGENSPMLQRRESRKKHRFSGTEQNADICTHCEVHSPPPNCQPIRPQNCQPLQPSIPCSVEPITPNDINVETIDTHTLNIQ